MPDTLPPPDPLAVEIASGQCAACDADLGGAFCAACGERAPTPEDESLVAFLRDQFHEVTSADGRLWRTLRALFVPGKLTTEYFAGRRGLYVRPVRIFLIVNILFFLWASFFEVQGFIGNPGLYRGNPAFRWSMIQAAWDAGVSGTVYDAAFAQRARTLAPTLIGVFVPAYALVITLLLVMTGRPVVRHVVLATHLVAVLMTSMVLLTMLMSVPLLLVLWTTGEVAYNLNDSIIVPVMLVVLSTYLVVAFRRVYALPWWGATLSGMALAAGGTTVALEVYRHALFYATLWTVDVPA